MTVCSWCSRCGLSGCACTATCMAMPLKIGLHCIVEPSVSTTRAPSKTSSGCGYGLAHVCLLFFLPPDALGSPVCSFPCLKASRAASCSLMHWNVVAAKRASANASEGFHSSTKEGHGSLWTHCQHRMNKAIVGFSLELPFFFLSPNLPREESRTSSEMAGPKQHLNEQGPP